MKTIILLFYFGLLFNQAVPAQDSNSLVLTEDAHYFDFWEGDWYEIKENNKVDSNSYFKVKRSVHPASFIEEWQLGNGSKSIALRAWDKTNSKWGFVWISDNGLYQVWDTRKINGQWYFCKSFNVNGDVYLSRQGFIQQPDGTVLRISEKSYDEKNWELRFKQILRKAGTAS
ncbi:MAG: hypothetical protein ACSLE0_23550 [Chitinophagaceae bacterium]